MASSGRISLLVSPELQTLLQAIRELDKEVAARIRKHTRPVVEPVWKEAVRGHTVSRVQVRVLSDTARASVSDSNILLKSGGVGQTHGTPNSVLAKGVEFGADRKAVKTLVSKKGTQFQRRTKAQFKLPRSRGYVVYPAARTVIPRIASLWVQTAVRTIHEQFEKGGVR